MGMMMGIRLDKKILLITGVFLLTVCVCSSKKKHDDSALAESPGSARAVLAPARQSVSDEVSQSRQNAITRAVGDVSPAVVGINVVQIQRVVEGAPFNDPFFRMFFAPREYTQKVKGLGSGFLISPEGYVLTNEHVVHNASEIVVTATDGKQYTASVVGSDFIYDVALLKIPGTNFPFIPLGNSDGLIIGEWVIALGNPFGLFDVNSKPTVTVGVISAAGMNFSGALKVEGRSYEGMIQTDASINGGNSGGPLVNSLGECIGINAFIISGSEYEKTSIGIGFAIPINRVKKVLPDLKKLGHLNRPTWTGLEIRDIRVNEAKRLGISARDGVIVDRVQPGSPASRAGLSSGDIIVAVDQIQIRSSEDYLKNSQLFDPGATDGVGLTIFRNGSLYEATLVPHSD
jgi:serine protease Do